MVKRSTFCIYCSGGASRVIGFYSFESNLYNFKPKKVVYDGSRIEVIDLLIGLFGSDLILFNDENPSYNKKKIHSSTSKFIHNNMDKYKIDYLLCFGSKILKEKFISAYPNKLINFHPSILPSFKGLSAINQSFEYKVSIIGNTAHFIDNGIDSGPIIIQTAMLAEDYEDYEDVLELQFPMIRLILRDILGYKIHINEIKNELSHRTKVALIPQKCNEC